MNNQNSNNADQKKNNYGFFQKLKLNKVSSLTAFILTLITLIAVAGSIVITCVYSYLISYYKEEIHSLEDKLNPYSNTQTDDNQTDTSNLDFEYQAKYPDMYAPLPIPNIVASPEKTVYLTFDDGPSNNSDKILDILKSFDVKATFYLVPKDNDHSNAVIKRIQDEGHAIGIHSYTHDYKKIYSSIDAFLDDCFEAVNRIKNVTGIMPETIRYPGGSINNYNSNLCVPLISEMLRRGYVYYDWNVDSFDASNKVTPSNTIFNQVVSGVHNTKDHPIVLMHDADIKTTTVDALPKILTQLKSEGYNFGLIDRTTPRASFSYPMSR